MTDKETDHETETDLSGPDALDAELVQDETDNGEAGPTSRQMAVAADMLPDTLYLLPLTERPFLPAQALPMLLNEEPWLSTVEKIMEAPQRVVGLILTRPEDPEDAGPEDFFDTGTVVRVHQVARNQGRIQFIAQGLRRFRITQWLSKEPPYQVRVEYPEDAGFENSDEMRAYSMAVIGTLKELIPLNPLYSEELKHFLNRFTINDPSHLADFAASLTTAEREDLQDILETVPVLDRMTKVITLLKKELEVARLQTRIRKQVEEKMTEQQRKFFLREQLKVIQQELGLAKDDRTADVDRFKERIETLTIPDSARERIEEELEKLSVLESGSPEYAVTRNYLDVLTDLPWGQTSEDHLDLERARKILDRDHDSLEDVKDRIIEFLAVGALKGEVSGSILLLVGPPGVGKTSIGRSVAEALGREFYRFSVGGMRDEAEIKGHRRTYIGAMPGKFIQAIRETGVANPVIMLDEIDKVGASYHGDPASALLEVLDPEQNSDFLDHYLDVRFDLSKVLFICTANQLDTIPGPLLDRMETIRLSGYIVSEKVLIAKHHLWPRLLQRSGVKPGQIKISDPALRELIEGYAREAGVRNLEKQLGRIVRKAAVKIVQGHKESIRVGIKDLPRYLGKPMFQKEKVLSGVGVITGLAWTAMGGATLNLEATVVHHLQRGFKLTGRLGEVMQESANIAYSYITAHLADYKAKGDFFDQAHVHLHVPEGATPKDGPSAGITIASALLSLALDRKPERSVAMTGELTLTGKVLPIGGVREKVIAARRNRIMEIILPEANRGDWEELPEYITRDITVHFVGHYWEVAKLLFP